MNLQRNFLSGEFLWACPKKLTVELVLGKRRGERERERERERGREREWDREREGMDGVKRRSLSCQFQASLVLPKKVDRSFARWGCKIHSSHLKQSQHPVRQFTIICLSSWILEKEQVVSYFVPSTAECGKKNKKQSTRMHAHTRTLDGRILTSHCFHFATPAELKRPFLLCALTLPLFVQLPAPEIRNL